jgi:riboflavin synthase
MKTLALLGKTLYHSVKKYRYLININLLIAQSISSTIMIKVYVIDDDNDDVEDVKVALKKMVI